MPPTKKSLGQHWLYDEASLDAMLEAAHIGTDDTVLEIGPGPGSLTAKLVKQARQVIAVEFDPDLARELPGRVPAANLQVVQHDILTFDFSSLPPGYKVVANIPYYLTSNLLRRLAEAPNHFSRAALLMQKEVVQRTVAKPGSMSLLSVAVQFYCDVEPGPLVLAQLFTPPPKVDSQILGLHYRAEPLFPGIDSVKFFRIVKAGFAQKRKTLQNSLASGLHLDREATAELLTAAGIPPGTRAQSLSLVNWKQLYDRL